MAWGRFMCLQLGQGWICTSASARCERRRPFFDLDSLTFGRATAGEYYRKLGACRLVGGLPIGGLVGLESLHPTPHRAQRPAEVRLELLDLLERVRLRVAYHLIALLLHFLAHLPV